jgi:SAM-dependent methyltransferase
MDETSKSRAVWGALERSVLQGRGIDIGCGPDPVMPDVCRFDVGDGDANVITRHVREQFDYVYSSHCLEHMRDPRAALREWWQLVRPGGHLFFTVPDEDLYEQGMFPSRFNADHKATFTIAKTRSWSAVSHNVLDLARELPASEIVSLALQDHGYDRRLLWHGASRPPGFVLRRLIRLSNALTRRGRPSFALDRCITLFTPIDQLVRPGTLAQIQCILRKTVP